MEIDVSHGPSIVQMGENWRHDDDPSFFPFFVSSKLYIIIFNSLILPYIMQKEMH